MIHPDMEGTITQAKTARGGLLCIWGKPRVDGQGTRI